MYDGPLEDMLATQFEWVDGFDLSLLTAESVEEMQDVGYIIFVKFSDWQLYREWEDEGRSMDNVTLWILFESWFSSFTINKFTGELLPGYCNPEFSVPAQNNTTDAGSCADGETCTPVTFDTSI